MEDMLVKFVTRRNRTVGCVIAMKLPVPANGGDVKAFVTGSLCHMGLDTFDKKEAVELAKGRAMAMAFHNRRCVIPYSLKADIKYMQNRAARYFQGCEVVVSPLPGVEPYVS